MLPETVTYSLTYNVTFSFTAIRREKKVLISFTGIKCILRIFSCFLFLVFTFNIIFFKVYIYRYIYLSNDFFKYRKKLFNESYFSIFILLYLANNQCPK